VGDLPRKISELTEIALKTLMLRNPVETNKGRISNRVKNRAKNSWHVGRKRRAENLKVRARSWKGGE
jgi:hypothetical protein